MFYALTLMPCRSILGGAFQRGAAMLTAAALFAAFSAPDAAAQSFTVLPGQTNTIPAVNAISASGSIVAGMLNNEPVLWIGSDSLLILPSPGEGSANGISADGSVVVGSTGGFTGPPTAARWDRGPDGTYTLTSISVPFGTAGSVANGVSADGSVIGGAGIYPGGGTNRTEAYKLEGGVVTRLGTLPGDSYSGVGAVSSDGMRLAGSSSLFATEGFSAFYWDGAMHDIGEAVSPGETYFHDMSANGVFIVGVGSGAIVRAYVYSNESGIELLPEPDGFSLMSAYTVSDTKTVFGSYFAGALNASFMWTENGGTVDFESHMNSLGVSLDGFIISRIYATNPAGRVVAGTGRVGNQWHAFRAELQASFMQFAAPGADDIVEPGSAYEVRFTAEPGANNVDVYLVRTFDPAGPRELIAENVPLDTGVWTWDVPEDLLSPSTFLVAVDVNDQDNEARTQRFRVRKRWWTHRVSGTVAEPEYEPIGDEHLFGFRQSNESLWPRSYWDAPTRRYSDLRTGYDPEVTPVGQVKFDPRQFAGTDAGAHPPWSAMVSAFGTGAMYTSLANEELGLILVNKPNPEAVARWDRYASGGYDGACFGMAIAVAAAFGHPDAFRSRWLPTIDSATPLSALQPSDEIRDAVHGLHAYQRSVHHLQQRHRDGANAITPRLVLQQLKLQFERDTRDLDRLVLFWTQFNSGSERGLGGHALYPLGMERTGEGVYTVDVFDTNLSPNRGQIVIDSTADAWDYNDPFWTGTAGTGLFMSMEVIRVLDPASGPWRYVTSGGSDGPSRSVESRAVEIDRAGLRSGELRVEIRGGDSGITSSTGTLRHSNGELTETIPGGFAEYAFTGRPSRPVAYVVPADSYTAELVSDEAGVSRITIDDGRASVSAHRVWTTGAVRDSITFSPGELAVAPSDSGHFHLHAFLPSQPGSDAVIRSVSLRNIVASKENGPTLSLSDDTSAVTLAMSVSGTYDLFVRSAGSAGSQELYARAIPIAAGSSHEVRPAWDVTTDSVRIDIDDDGDGLVDRSIHVSDDGFPVGTDGQSRGTELPGHESAIHLSVFPNPVREMGDLSTEVWLENGAAGTISVYDILGRRVETVFSGTLPSGLTTMRLDSAGSAPGIYFIRAAFAGHGVAVRRLVVTG